MSSVQTPILLQKPDDVLGVETVMCGFGAWAKGVSHLERLLQILRRSSMLRQRAWEEMRDSVPWDRSQGRGHRKRVDPLH